MEDREHTKHQERNMVIPEVLTISANNNVKLTAN